MARDRSQKQSLGWLHPRIKESRVLLVGAGGIGCELLKNLVLTGYGEIHIIDLDTIDLSNLNRQFLFRHEHIKKSKATVAKEVAQRFNPKVKLVAHHANIKDAQFNVEWFSSFAIVFNALDNLEARRHVNRMCLAADVPLIESGTTGFNGQVQVIKKGKTACYDCNPKTTPKSFPVCTIRSTPSQPIHCIVWAKSYLLPELFGASEDETPELDTAADAENAAEIIKLKEEAEALKKIRESMGSDDFAKRVFDKVFKEDIERLAKMEDMWKTRKPPTALNYEEIAKDAEAIPDSITETDQRPWTLPEVFAVFKTSLARLSTRFQADQQTAASDPSLPQPLITFDKDDTDTLDFVAAASNLRSTIFGIPLKSKFDIKQMAGNIIPAIATTNAMIAGLCVMQAFKVMKNEYGRTKMIFVDRGNMSAGAFDPPNPDCAVCGVAMSRVQVDIQNATLDHLVNGVLKEQLGYGEEILVMNEHGGIVFDPDMEDNLVKKLKEVEINDGSLIIIKDDDDEEPRVDLHLIVEVKAVDGQKKDDNAKEGGKTPVLLLTATNGDEKFEIPKKPKRQTETNGIGTQVGDKVEESGTATPSTVVKRKREIDDVGADGASTPAKKVQQGAPSSLSQPDKVNGVETIILDEEEGAIEID